ncbi:hypothetical protein CFN78_00100 [Amycolatopsis antarctica]|uniref:Uncharacterized protein n=1 Tax=Amycolatopsis antarctica TaxID=1854586 RepID=A0A263D877_9PSEU|nr:hypothetical protein [Amycolatopsis antarctica]OZM74690.1 hypothetical protein CFN78_00100 [Amycolatopsis antarctica]
MADTANDQCAYGTSGRGPDQHNRTTRTTILVIAAGTGVRAQIAAHAAAASLRHHDDDPDATVTAVTSQASGLAAQLDAATHILVLDPSTLRALCARTLTRLTGTPRPMSAAPTLAERITLIELLHQRRRQVRWITRPTQLRTGNP